MAEQTSDRLSRLLSRFGDMSLKRADTLSHYCDLNALISILTKHDIVSITIGPGKDSELTRKSVQHFIDRSEAYNHVNLVSSKIPFRT